MTWPGTIYCCVDSEVLVGLVSPRFSFNVVVRVGCCSGRVYWCTWMLCTDDSNNDMVAGHDFAF